MSRRATPTRFAPFAFLVLVLLLDGLRLPAQGTRADYERANRQRQLTENKVFRQRVRANWFPNNTQFGNQLARTRQLVPEQHAVLVSQ